MLTKTVVCIEAAPSDRPYEPPVLVRGVRRLQCRIDVDKVTCEAKVDQTGARRI
jgi:hypothetical protein